MVSGPRDVQRNDSNRSTITDHVVEGALSGQVGVIIEGRPECSPFVVIARNYKEGDIEPCEYLQCHRVFVFAPLVHDVTGEKYDIGSRIKAVKMADRLCEI